MKPNYVEIPPNAARTLAALRELGYDSMSAICDLVDNSIDAGSDSIEITIRAVGQSHVIEICDNGRGMTQAKLQEALRLGSDVDGRDASKDLGKYGMGLVTASLSIAKTIHILTREEGKAGYEATFDVATVEKHNKWILELKAAQSRDILSEIGDYGTRVRLSNVDRMDDTNVTRITARLTAYIGRVFRNFIADGVKIKVNRKVVGAVDPLMRSHPQTQLVYDQPLDLGKGRMVRLTIVELPDLDAEETAGILPNLSGFYVIRNRREIAAAQTFGFYKHHHSYSHFRAELIFGGDLDQDFHVDVKKTSILPNDQVLAKIEHVARRFIEKSGREGRDRAIEKTKLSHSLIKSALKNGEAPTYRTSDHGDEVSLFRREDGVFDYNSRHPLVQLVSSINMKKVDFILDAVCHAMAEVQDPEAIRKMNLALQGIMSAGTSRDTWAERDRLAAKMK
jgi:hypothetical protein